ncbi:MAG TPA: tetratricopeptide repeat protein [Burkholderiales bacterium]|nr:tetratricopeptide repeat protein [Burkholderiales bacterium]
MLIEKETTKLLEAKGWTLLEEQKYDEAKQEFAEVFAADPHNLAAFQGTIAALRKQHNFASSEALLAKALEIYPKAPGILAERAWLLVDEKKENEAIAAFNDLLEVKRDDETLFLEEISLLRLQHRLDEARKLAAEASQIFPDSPRLSKKRGWIAFYTKDYHGSAEIFKAVLDRDPSDEEALQGRIATFRMQGDYEQAILRASAAIALLPPSARNYAGIYSERAWAHFAQGRYEEAEADFRKALENAREEHRAGAFMNLAWALVRQDNESAYADAVVQCQSALDLDGNRPDAYGCLGVIAFKRHQILEAETYLLRSIDANDPSKGFYADLGALCTAGERYEEAKKYLEKALTINPDDAYAHREMGSLLIQTGEPKEATREFRRAAAIDPTSSQAWKGLAIALMERDQLHDAERELRGAINRKDMRERWELHLELSRLLTRVGDDTGDDEFYNEALKEVATSIGLKSGNPESFFQAGIVKWKLDDYPGALKSFQLCIKADSNHIDAQMNAAQVQALIRKGRLLPNRFVSFALASVFLLQLIILWILRLVTVKISESAIMVLVPILLGLLVVAVMLPWLRRLKLTGLEAELNEPKPKDTLVAGPKGVTRNGLH